MIQPQFPDGAQVEATRRGSSRSGRADEPHGDVQYAHDLFHVKTELLLFFFFFSLRGVILVAVSWSGSAVTHFPSKTKVCLLKKKEKKKRKMMFWSANVFSRSVVDSGVSVSGQSSLEK